MLTRMDSRGTFLLPDRDWVPRVQDIRQRAGAKFSDVREIMNNEPHQGRYV